MDVRRCLFERIDEMNLPHVTPIRKVARSARFWPKWPSFSYLKYFFGANKPHKIYYPRPFTGNMSKIAICQQLQYEKMLLRDFLFIYINKSTLRLSLKTIALWSTPTHWSSLCGINVCVEILWRWQMCLNSSAHCLWNIFFIFTRRFHERGGCKSRRGGLVFDMGDKAPSWLKSFEGQETICFSRLPKKWSFPKPLEIKKDSLCWSLVTGLTCMLRRPCCPGVHLKISRLSSKENAMIETTIMIKRWVRVAPGTGDRSLQHQLLHSLHLEPLHMRQPICPCIVPLPGRQLHLHHPHAPTILYP